MLDNTKKHFAIAIIAGGLIILNVIFSTSSVYARSCDIESPIRIGGIQQNDIGVAPTIRLHNLYEESTTLVTIIFHEYLSDDDGVMLRFFDYIAPNSFSDFETNDYVADGFNGYVEVHFTHHDCVEAERLPDTTAENLSTIEGTITNENGDVQTNVPVTLYVGDGDVWIAGNTVRTDETGVYRLTDLYPGKARLRFGPDMTGYNDQVQYYPDSSTIEFATEIPIGADSTITDINATIRRMTRISGRAISSHGGAPDDVIAYIYRRVTQRNGALPFDDKSSQAWEIVSSAEADFRGNYVVWDLEPGTYHVGFSATDFYLDSFANSGAPYVGYATDIEITSGQSIANVNSVFTSSSVNVLPLAITDKLTVRKGAEESTLLGFRSSVLDNDEDANQSTPQEIRDYIGLDETVLTAILVNEPNHGTLTFNTDGTFLYQHDGSDNLTDSFTYKASDGELESNLVEVVVQVFNTQLYIPLMAR